MNCPYKLETLYTYWRHMKVRLSSTHTYTFSHAHLFAYRRIHKTKKKSLGCVRSVWNGSFIFLSSCSVMNARIPAFRRRIGVSATHLYKFPVSLYLSAQCFRVFPHRCFHPRSFLSITRWMISSHLEEMPRWLCILLTRRFIKHVLRDLRILFSPVTCGARRAVGTLWRLSVI